MYHFSWRDILNVTYLRDILNVKCVISPERHHRVCSVLAHVFFTCSRDTVYKRSENIYIYIVRTSERQPRPDRRATTKPEKNGAMMQLLFPRAPWVALLALVDLNFYFILKMQLLLLFSPRNEVSSSCTPALECMWVAGLCSS